MAQKFYLGFQIHIFNKALDLSSLLPLAGN